MGLELPQTVTDVADTFGSATGVLISLGIGVLFAPAWTELRRASLVVGTRLGTGLVVGVTIVVLFGLDGADRTIMLLLSVAPLAFVTVTFASLENLDVRLATSALSLSLATSLVLFLVVVLLTA
jgi:predicted permease